jgi:hypothetical protein
LPKVVALKECIEQMLKTEFDSSAENTPGSRIESVFKIAKCLLLSV